MRWQVETSYSSYVGIGERSDYGPQIIGRHANVAIAHYHYFVLGFRHKASQFCNFVIYRFFIRAKYDSNAMLGKIVNNFFKSGNYRIVSLPGTKKNLVLRVILTAKAGKILVSLRIEPSDRF